MLFYLHCLAYELEFRTIVLPKLSSWILILNLNGKGLILITTFKYMGKLVLYIGETLKNVFLF